MIQYHYSVRGTPEGRQNRFEHFVTRFPQGEQWWVNTESPQLSAEELLQIVEDKG